jgi:outer membrane biosynthesis protein TonB
MKKSRATIKILLALAMVLTLAGCRKHKPPLPPQGQPPAVIEQPPPQPLTPEPEVTTTKEEPPPNPQPPTPAPKPPARHVRAPKKPATGNGEKPGTEIAKATPPKIVIQEPPQPVSQNATAAAPLTAHDDAAHSAASTTQLNDSTEANLSGLRRKLSPPEQTTVSQIRDYLSQSGQATKDGDVMRARNLALKAHLLSDELARPR